MTDGTAENDERPVVLAIDDEPRVVQAFDLWLGEDYRVETATSGSDGLELLSDAVDIVLLDRHMPGMSGEEVLTEIRERGFDCRVTMVTAVDPDFDIVDMPFDDYVSKPVDDDELRAVIESLLELDEYDETLNDLYAVSRKIATLEDQMPRQSLDENDRYARLHEQREELLTEADDFVTELDLEENPEFFDVPDAERPQ